MICSCCDWKLMLLLTVCWCCYRRCYLLYILCCCCSLHCCWCIWVLVRSVDALLTFPFICSVISWFQYCVDMLCIILLLWRVLSSLIYVLLSLFTFVTHLRLFMSSIIDGSTLLIYSFSWFLTTHSLHLFILCCCESYQYSYIVTIVECSVGVDCGVLGWSKRCWYVVICSSSRWRWTVVVCCWYCSLPLLVTWRWCCCCWVGGLPLPMVGRSLVGIPVYLPLFPRYLLPYLRCPGGPLLLFWPLRWYIYLLYHCCCCYIVVILLFDIVVVGTWCSCWACWWPLEHWLLLLLLWWVFLLMEPLLGYHLLPTFVVYSCCAWWPPFVTVPGLFRVVLTFLDLFHCYVDCCVTFHYNYRFVALLLICCCCCWLFCCRYDVVVVRYAIVVVHWCVDHPILLFRCWNVDLFICRKSVLMLPVCSLRSIDSTLRDFVVVADGDFLGVHLFVWCFVDVVFIHCSLGDVVTFLLILFHLMWHCSVHCDAFTHLFTFVTIVHCCCTLLLPMFDHCCCCLFIALYIVLLPCIRYCSLLLNVDVQNRWHVLNIGS